MSYVRQIALAAAACLYLLSLGAASLAAAEHHGQVKFAGVPVPGATVTAVQGEKKLVTITDAMGNYSFPDLSDGVWTIQVEMLCFSAERRDVTIAAEGNAAEWELKLLPLKEIKAETGMPAVSEAASKPQSGVSAGAKDANKLRGLQVEPRKAEQAQPPGANAQGSFQRAELNAAAADASVGAAATDRDSRAFSGQSADELVQRASDGFLINGSANNSASSPFAQRPAFGNMRKGMRSLYNGNFGLVLDNSALDARSYSFTGQNTAKPSYNPLLGSASFGGPLRIPHLITNGPMFVVTYQFARNRNATTQPGRMPTQAERNGDFSQTLNSLGQPVQIFDPATGVQFPGNVVPKDRISPQAKALLDLYPPAMVAGSDRYNYQIPIVGTSHQDGIQSRLSRTIGRNNYLSGGFGYQSTRSSSPNLFGFLDKANSTGVNGNVNWRRSFTMRFVMNFGYQYSRMVSLNTPFFSGRSNVSGEAGITGNNQDPINWGPPSLSFSGGATGLSDAQASFNRNQTNSFTFSTFWSRGRHGMTFGADFRRRQFNYLAQQDARGSFMFTGAATQAKVNGVAVPGTGYDLADFILGIPDTSSIAFGNADKYFRASMYDAYFTDDFRVNSGFTLNIGLRWEYGSPITELYGRLVNLDIAPGFTAAVPVIAYDPVGGITGRTYPDSLVHPDKHAFQPRLGIAWRPFPASSLVIRAGYGIYFDTSVYNTIAMQMAQQSPLSKSLSVQNSPDHPLTLANGFYGSPATTPQTFAIDPNFRVGYVQTWQLSIQRDLPFALQMSATYLGNKGTRGAQRFVPNTYPAGVTNPCPLCPAGFIYLTSNGNSNRHAGQIQLRRRLHNGFTATLAYTYSKSIDDAALGGRGQGSAVLAQNWLDLSAERALSNFDQRHLMNLQLQYTSGMGVAGGALLGGWRGRLLKEWTFASQIAAGSGFPLTPVYPGAVGGTGVTGPLRPDHTGASLYAAPRGLFLNPLAFAAPSTGHWGNAGRNSITGPAQFSLIASMGRTFRVRDRISLDLRIDATNALNHVTFTSWNTTVGGPQFGLPNGVSPMRSIQTTLRARF